jgi:hypothetical protein
MYTLPCVPAADFSGSERGVMKICVAIPLHNAANWLSSFSPLSEYEYRFFDNASTDGTRDLLVSRRFHFDSVDQMLPRPISWLRAYECAAAGNSDWIKPLFVGDSLRPGLSTIEEPESAIGIILFRYLISSSHESTRLARRFSLTGQLDRDIALYGPFSGPPVAIMFRKDVFLESLNYFTSSYSEWLADFQIFKTLALNSKYVSKEEISGIFNPQKRQTFKKLRKDPRCLREEMDLMSFHRGLIKELTIKDRIQITKRIVDLGLHRLPSAPSSSATIKSAWKVWG